MESLDHPQVRALIRLALEEDQVRTDLTSELLVPQDSKSKAKIFAKEELVVCGLPLIALIFAELGWSVDLKLEAQDGQFVRPGVKLASLAGSTRHLLAAERVILNFLQRLSGVASFTAEFVKGSPKPKVLDTRKTTPGFRLLEKYAVRIGGAFNHRQNLADMILIKNNHIDAFIQRSEAKQGGLRAAIEEAVSRKDPKIRVEVEVRSLKELSEILGAHVDVVMFDNMNDSEIKQGVELLRQQKNPPLIEVSGGVTRSRLSNLEELGVDLASVGALTRKAPWVDISMHIEQ